MDVIDVCGALSNRTRLRLLTLLDEKSGSAVELYRRYSDRYDEEKHRESIYRSLETLVEAGLLEKEYSKKEKELQYILMQREICIDLPAGEVKAKD